MQGCHWQLPWQARAPDSAFAWNINCQQQSRPCLKVQCSNGKGTATNSYDWLRDPTRTSKPVLQHYLKEHEATRAWQRTVSTLRQQLQGSLENHLWRAALALAAGQGDGEASAGGGIGQGKGTSLLYWKYSRDVEADTSDGAAAGGPSTWKYVRRPSAADPSRHVHLLVASHKHQQPQERVLLDEGKETARVAATRNGAGCYEFRVDSFSVSPDKSLFAYTSTDEYIPAAGIRGLSYTLHVRYSHSGAPPAPPVPAATGPLAWVPPSTQTQPSEPDSQGCQKGAMQQLLYTAASGSQLQLIQFSPSGAKPRGSATQVKEAVVPATLLRYADHHVLLLRHVHWQGWRPSSKQQGVQQGMGQVQAQGAAKNLEYKARQEKGQRETHRQPHPAQGVWPAPVQAQGQSASRHAPHMILVEAVDSALVARAAWAVVTSGSGSSNSHRATSSSYTPGVTLVRLGVPSRGQRVAAAPCPAPCGGFLVWSWDAEACATGKLSWCDPQQSRVQLTSDHSSADADSQSVTHQEMAHHSLHQGAQPDPSFSSEALVSAEHLLLRPPQGWALEEVQVQGSHVLVMYRQVAVGGHQASHVPDVSNRDAHDLDVLKASAAASSAWQALQLQGSELSSPSAANGTDLGAGQDGCLLVGGTTRLRIEVYSVRAVAKRAPARQGTQEKGSLPVSASVSAPSPPRLVFEAAQDVALAGHPVAKLESLKWRRAPVGQGLGSAGLWRHTVRLVTSAPCTPAVTLDLTLAPPASGSTSTAAAVSASLAVPGVKYGTLHVKSRDGTLVPVSLAMPDVGSLGRGRRPELPPVVLRVYGAYGIQDDMRVAPVWQTLVEQGVICATVHVRGGGMHGPAWHESGRGGLKLKGLEDLLAAAEALIAGRYCHPRKLCLVGDSAGGWLAGAALNQRPDLFSATVLTVASLDVVTTFHTDPCPGDSAELGDARGDLTVRREVLAWSPADNLPDPQAITRLWNSQRRLWPHILVRVGLFDSRVPPWDPGRCVAKLKDALQAGEKAVMAQYQQGSSSDGQGPDIPRPKILMQVKPCGHEGYDSPADDATLAAFVLDVCSETQP